MKELLYKKSEAVAALNRVDGFHPMELARKIGEEGQEEQLYLDVKYRKLWFRLVNPAGKIISRIITFTENMAVVEARIYLDKCDHLFSGESNINGSIFVDCHNQPDFTDQNTIVYGHNMKNGSMFGTLDKYQDKELFEQHPEFYLYLPDKILKYRIFSCYAGRTGSEGYRYHFPEAEDFQTFLDTVSSYRDYDTGTELSATDRIVTLSTCVNSRRNYRYLVHGKLSSEIITEE